jgi:hypothetical protein
MVSSGLHYICNKEIEMEEFPCEECEEMVPVDEYCGNDREDGTSEYLCPDCYDGE